MTFADAPKEDVFDVAMGQICLLIKDDKEYFEQKYKVKIEKMIHGTKDLNLRAILENIIKVYKGEE